MKRLTLRDFGVLAVLLTILGGGIQKASAEIEYDTYFHCGDYLDPNPYLNTIRYAPSDDSPKPMWAISYGVKNPDTKVRMEVSCLIREVSEDSDGKIVFAGENCDVVLTQEADKTFSVTYEDKPKITGCIFDLPREQAVEDLDKDIAGPGVTTGPN